MTVPVAASHSDRPLAGTVLNLTVDDVSIAVTTAGAGKPMVLLHCSGSSAAQWRDLGTILARDFHLAAPDFYGCGSTGTWPGHHPIRLADHARMVAEVVQAHGCPVHLVGHSFGGAVALRLTLDLPALVRSLVLIEPVSFQLLRGEPADRTLHAEIRNLASAVFDCALNGDGHTGMARFVDYWNGPGAWSHLSSAAQARLAAQIGGVAANFTAVFADLTRLADCRRIDVPTLVLRGSASPSPSRRLAEMIADAIPDAALRTIDGAGHMAPLTHAEAVGAAVMDFMGRGGQRDASAA